MRQPILLIESFLAADQGSDPGSASPMHHHVMRLGRRIGIAIAGGLIIAAGVAMLVLPGPGLVVIALGLAVLSLEFERQRVWLARIKAKGVKLKQDWASRKSRSGDG